MSGKQVASSCLRALCIAVVVVLLSMGMADSAPSSRNGNTGPHTGGHTPQQGGAGHVPTFQTVEELCQWLCERRSPQYEYGCPPSCEGAILGSWSKRAARGRRYDDFSFGLDDYLFMKLLGRDLGDKA